MWAVMPRNWAARASAQRHGLPEEWVSYSIRCLGVGEGENRTGSTRLERASDACKFLALEEKLRAALLIECLAGEDRGPLDERPDAFVGGTNEC